MYYGFEYFAGANVTVKVGDMTILEASGISVDYQNSKRPIYGYSSRYFDAVAEGQSLVTGTLLVNYVHQDYLFHVIEMEALTYIRGRSIANAFIIIDEAQNLSVHEIKTILTRVGEGTKIVLTGDIEQIDNIYIDETSNGLVHAVEKFKDFPIAGHVSLQKGERSKVATIAANVL